jgi:hypothetical protein
MIIVSIPPAIAHQSLWVILLVQLTWAEVTGSLASIFLAVDSPLAGWHPLPSVSPQWTVLTLGPGSKRMKEGVS